MMPKVPEDPWSPIGVIPVHRRFKLTTSAQHAILDAAGCGRRKNVTEFIAELELAFDLYAAEKLFCHDSRPKLVASNLQLIRSKADELHRAIENLDPASREMLSKQGRGKAWTVVESSDNKTVKERPGFTINECSVAALYAINHVNAVLSSIEHYLRPGRHDDWPLHKFVERVALLLKQYLGVDLDDKASPSLAAVLRTVIEMADGENRGEGERDIRPHLKRIRARNKHT